ncbi:MAG: hypothetical protein IJ074_02790 [Clostridia bacterium]|nr:hypothetical protein [Clostridia bacterium]
MQSAPEYRPEYCERLVRYFSAPAYREWTDTVWHSNGETRQERPLRLPNPLPTFEGFAGEIGATTALMRAWAIAHPEFAYACERAKDAQRDFLLQNALLGLYHTAFARFVAELVCGMEGAGAIMDEDSVTLADDIADADD